MGRKPTKNLNLPRGMRARRKGGGKLWYYYDAGGKPRKEIPLGNDYTFAVQKWADLESTLKPNADQITTFKSAADRYQRDVMPHKSRKSQSDNLKQLKKMLEYFNTPPVAYLEDITPQIVRKYMDWRRASPVAANREKALLSHIWNKCREWGYTDKPNPCTGVAGFKETGRDVYVEDDLFAKVYAAACIPLKDAMDVAYLTGQRPADVLKILETDIKDSVLYITQGKTDQKLRISVNGQLQAVVARILARKAAYSVRSLRLICDETGQPVTAGTLRLWFDKAREAAKVTKDDFQFRDLRAKALTDKAESSGNIRDAQKQAGHASSVMTEHYVRNRKGDLVEPTK